jgi:energy-converting hydrogenase Eha subunit B
MASLPGGFGYLPWPVDLALMFGLAASLGLLLASHVALSVGLARQGPWQRALLAFVLPPLAPLWGYSGKLHARSLLWIIALVTHVACLTAAAIGGAGG